MRGRRRDKRGAALLLALSAMAIVSMFAASYLAALRAQIGRANQYYWDAEAMALAEGGLNKALAGLHADPEGYAGEPATVLGPGRYAVAATRGEEAGVYRLEAEGWIASGRREVARVRITAEAVVSKTGTLTRLTWLEVRR